MELQGYYNMHLYLAMCVSFFLSLAGRSDSACVFHEFILSNGSIARDWRGKIKDQNTEVTYRVRIDENICHFVSTDSTASTYSRACISAYGDKYLVAHEEQDQSGSRFVCMQFVMRTDHVMQVRESEVSPTMNRRLCSDNKLNLNPWLVIDMAHASEDLMPIPLQGGFSLRIFDKRHNIGVCDAYNGQTRLESECSTGDGLVFYFRYRRCLPDALYMYTTQRTLCIAHWQEGPYTFALLRHDDLAQYMWILRYSTELGHSDTMVLFADLVADTNANIDTTHRYLALDAVRDEPMTVTSLCVDGYDVCTHRSDACEDPAMSLTCMLTCGLCHASRPKVCRFPSGYSGDWYNAQIPGTLAISIQGDSLTTFNNNSREDFNCVEWDAEAEPDSQSEREFAKTYMLVSTFSNGCQPRYSCVHFMQNSPSALFLQLSQSLSWPFTSTASEPVDCSKFVYDSDDSLIPNMFRSKTHNLVYSRTPGTVPCELPSTEGAYVAILENQSRCTANIIQSPSTNSFRVIFSGCTQGAEAYDVSGTYTCTENTRMFHRHNQLIVTHRDSKQDSISCWLLPRDQHDVFYLLSAADCNEAVHKRIERNRLQALATITRTGAQPGDVYEDTVLPEETPYKRLTEPTLRKTAPTISGSPNLTQGATKLGDINVNPAVEASTIKYIPYGNTTLIEDGPSRISIVSIAVVIVIVLGAVVQSVCVCKG